MKALILSDSHGNESALKKAFDREKQLDAAVFLGDGCGEYFRCVRNLSGVSTYCVRGNNDFDHSLALSAIVEICGHKFLISHGHSFGVSLTDLRILNAAKANGCECALFGHTHRRFAEEKDGIFLFNPGSVSQPRDGKAPSYGLITEENGALKFKHMDLL